MFWAQRHADLTLRAAVGYPSYKQGGHKMRQMDWAARYIVLAVKGDMEALQKSYTEIGKRRYDHTNYDSLVGSVCKWAADTLSELHPEGAVLAAIPNSDSTPQAATFANARLVERIVALAGPRFETFDGLRFREPMEKARNGGSRSKEVLAAAMVLTKRPPARTIVMFDDVCTSGGHLLAAQEALKNTFDVKHAITAGRTVWDPPERMWPLSEEQVSGWW